MSASPAAGGGAPAASLPLLVVAGGAVLAGGRVSSGGGSCCPADMIPVRPPRRQCRAGTPLPLCRLGGEEERPFTQLLEGMGGRRSQTPR